MPNKKPNRTTRKGTGKGWGGEATRNAGDKPPRPFTADSETRRTVPNGKGDPDKMALRRALAATDAERAAQLREMLAEIALNGETENVRVQAITAWLNRHEGLPIARTVSFGADDVRGLTDAELAAELARTARAASDIAAGGMAQDVPQEP